MFWRHLCNKNAKKFGQWPGIHILLNFWRSIPNHLVSMVSSNASTVFFLIQWTKCLIFFLDQNIFATRVYDIINTAAEFKWDPKFLINSVKQSVWCTLVQSSSKFKMETSTSTSKSLMFNSIRPLLTTVLPLLWLGRIGVGLSYGLMGPIQPYLARYILLGFTFCSDFHCSRITNKNWIGLWITNE